MTCPPDETHSAGCGLIRPEYAADQQFRARLRREVAAARQVPRFCTAPVLGANLDADVPWVATEYIDAPTLDVAVMQYGPLHGLALESFAAGVASLSPVGQETVRDERIERDTAEEAEAAMQDLIDEYGPADRIPVPPATPAPTPT